MTRRSSATLLCLLVVIASTFADKAGYHAIGMMLMGIALSQVALSLDAARAAIIALDEVRGR